MGSGAGHSSTRAGGGRWCGRGPVRWCLPCGFGRIRLTQARIRAIRSLTSACFPQVGRAPGRLARVAGVYFLWTVTSTTGSHPVGTFRPLMSGVRTGPPARRACRKHVSPVPAQPRNAARPGAESGRFYVRVHGRTCTASALRR